MFRASPGIRGTDIRMTKCISLHYKEKDASSDQAGARKQARAGKHAEGYADAVSGATQNGSGQNGSQARPEGNGSSQMKPDGNNSQMRPEGGEGGQMQNRPQDGGNGQMQGQPEGGQMQGRSKGGITGNGQSDLPEMPKGQDNVQSDSTKKDSDKTRQKARQSNI